MNETTTTGHAPAINKLIERINSNKEIQKNFKKLSHYSAESFIKDAKQYIKAIDGGRMICSIKSVSPSGMSRNIKFLSCEKGRMGGRSWYSNYFCLFISLGFTESRARDHYFTINGCGMDMIFHTNYTICHNLKNLGIITKKQCDALCQATPSII